MKREKKTSLINKKREMIFSFRKTESCVEANRGTRAKTGGINNICIQHADFIGS